MEFEAQEPEVGDVLTCVADRPSAAERPAWPSPLSIALGVWAAGAIAIFLVAFVRVVRFARVLALAKEADEGVLDLVEEVRASLDLRRALRVVSIPGEVAPMVWWSGGRAVLVLPAELWKRLDDRQRLTLVAHELAHLKRGDDRGPLAGAGGDGPLLVASRRLGDAPRLAGGGGALLRRLGGLDGARRRPVVRRGVVGDRGFS